MDVPPLNSRLGAPTTIYLECGGVPAQAWGSRTVPAIPAYQGDINVLFSTVSSLFAAFNVNATTIDPGKWNLDGKQPWRPQIRAVIGSNGDWFGAPGEGGTAVVGCFNSPWEGNSVYIFSDLLGSSQDVGYEACHELGHAFGLLHQSAWAFGQKAAEYRPGPIMGNPFIPPFLGWVEGTNSDGQTQNDRMVMGALLGAAIPGDLNFDGSVDMGDAGILRSDYVTKGPAATGIEAVNVGRNFGKKV